jgi:hypothetical protein
MALVLYDRVQQTGTANTTVSFTLSATPAGYQSFAVVGNANTTYYSSFDSSGNWEVGIGTYATGGTLTRTTILSSSNSGSAVTFSGTVTVFISYPASKSVNLDASNAVSNTRIDPRVLVGSNTATSVTPDISLYDMYVWQALSTASTLTINIPTGTPLNGDKLMFRIQDNNSSGAVTLSWAITGTGCFRVINVPFPTTTGGSGKVVYVGCIYNSLSSTWDVLASGTQV